MPMLFRNWRRDAFFDNLSLANLLQKSAHLDQFQTTIGVRFHTRFHTEYHTSIKLVSNWYPTGKDTAGPSLVTSQVYGPG